MDYGCFEVGRLDMIESQLDSPVDKQYNTNRSGP